ncbi:MAG: hypothetical protein C0501_30770 [Isosphaera sp.]|nr:hypothetical protein [Isosphaera sp.]
MRRFQHSADIGGERVPYSARVRRDRGKWMVVFRGPDGREVKALTTHDARGKTPPDALHADAPALLRAVYRPDSPAGPVAARPGWDELLDEVGRTSPHTRSETLRQYRAAVKAFREVLPEVASPLDVSEEQVRRFGRLWLAAPSRRGNGGGKRSPATLSYYLRGLSGFSNHLVDLGRLAKNLWKGVRAPKGERARKPAPTADDVRVFFEWARARYPDWASLHALLELKLVSGCRTADVCRLRTGQLSGGSLTFSPDVVKTKEARSLPLPARLAAALRAVAGPVHLWEGLFADIPKYRKASNGYPPAFSWRTVYHVVNNLFREYREAHPDRPGLSPHGLRRRAVTAAVRELGSADAAALALGLHAQTARAHYLDASQAFETDAAMRRVGERMLAEITEPERNQSRGKRRNSLKN